MRPYYNQRTGSGERPEWTLQEAAQLVAESFSALDNQGYFQRSFGYYCIDNGKVVGRHGTLDLYFYRQTGIRLEGNSVRFIETADETTLFTLIEFLFDHVAKPKPHSGWHHDFSGCGWHFDPHGETFDISSARKEWRETINGILDIYGEGYELSDEGEIVRLTPDGMTNLVQTVPPPAAGDANIAKVNSAVKIFRRGLSSREEQKQAVRSLADVLEFYRPRVKEHLLKDDEAALFNIANNYAIRHHRADQKNNYDGPWLTWLFYLYLSSVHLVLALIHGFSITVPPNPSPPPQSREPSDDDIPF